MNEKLAKIILYVFPIVVIVGFYLIVGGVHNLFQLFLFVEVIVLAIMPSFVVLRAIRNFEKKKEIFKSIKEE